MHRDGRPLVTIDQAAALAGVTRRTIYNWLSAGRLETLRTPSGTQRIFRDTLFRRLASLAEAHVDPQPSTSPPPAPAAAARVVTSRQRERTRLAALSNEDFLAELTASPSKR